MTYYADIAITISIYVVLGVSLNLLVGYTGRISLAHAIFYGLGGFTAARLTLPTAEAMGFSSRGVVTGAGWNWFPALVAAGLVAFIFALVISLPAVRLVRGEYLILLTLAFQLVLNQLMEVLNSVTGGPYGLAGVPPISIFGETLARPEQALWPMLALAVFATLACWGLGESPFGRLLKGLREHESAVSSVGKNPAVPELLAFGISAGIAGTVGAMAGFYYQNVVPGNYTLDLSILIVSIVVLGGAGNITGTILAAIVLGTLEPVLRSVAGDQAIPWQAVIYGAALVLMMRFRPQGLLPEGVGLSRLISRRTREQDELPTAEDALDSLKARAAKSADNVGEDNAVVLEVAGLNKHFGGLAAVDDVSFGLPPGEITALVGPNGAGKTTIFNIICGTVPADSGEIRLGGADVTGRSAHRLARLGMARSFQDMRVWERVSARDNVAMAVPDQPGEKVWQLILRPRHTRMVEQQVQRRALECLAFVGIADKAQELVGNLSYGDQKLVAIARLVATNCHVLLLDEPTSGVDPAQVDRVIEGIIRLKELGHTICLVEHSVHFVEQLASHVIFLDEGRVVAEGALRDLMERQDLTELYFGS